MNRKPIVTIFVFTLLLACPLPAAVTVREESIVIPTYLVGPPDPNPQFYFGGASQGAEHRIYPYPLYNRLTTEKADKTYKIVYLENEYLKVGILPESGGKIFEAIDKTNGYNFFYRQHVIKPALISLLGAWISGGVEWDVPHHHRATSFLPMQYKIDDTNPDGSKTVWVGELELRDRMRWAVGTTLRPGKSYLEVSFHVMNRTPLPTSMLCFSNVAVHVDENYQVIFPPSTQWGTHHSKREMVAWPIGTGRYGGADFTGVDLSWYKNHISSNSVFAWNYSDDFFAGYDHGRKAGTMSIADHHVVPGKKFWTWGNGPRGRMQDKLLTDSDGPYIELMVGAYSDNQPDYTWLAPYETRTWKQYWYPFREIGGVKNANTDAAVNLDVKDGKASFGFYTTSAHPRATVSLKLKDQSLASETIAIDPAKPYLKEIPLPAGADQHDLRAAISVDGKELIAYSPLKLVPEPMPQAYTPPSTPDQFKTNEELYLAGLRIEAFHSPQFEPEPYFEEALKRDPGDARANTALAIRYLKKARYADAEKHLKAAVERVTANHTMPRDGEAFYYLGVAQKALGKIDEAEVNFHKSTWTAAWRSPGYLEAAQIEVMRGDDESAIERLTRAIDADAKNIRALTLKAVLVSRLGRPAEARALAAIAAAIDPLDVDVMTLQSMLDGKGAALMDTLVEFPATALEVAAECMHTGQWEPGLAYLTTVVDGHAAATKPVSPLLYYTMAYFAQKADRPQEAVRLRQLAMSASPEYVFPFQREMIDVLEAAIAANPSDSRAPYYLGNLLFDWQPQRAVELWEKSVAAGADFPVVYRNLAVVYTRNNDRARALAMLEKAAQLGGNAMVFRDLDQLYEQDAVSPQKRLSLLEQNAKVIDQDDAIARLVNLKIFAGKTDEALVLLKSRFFRPWEGGGGFAVGDSWANAMLIRGQQHLKAGRFAQALEDFKAALVLPESLLEASAPVAREPEVEYWTGLAHEGLGQRDEARQAWQASASNRPDGNAGDARGGRGPGGRGGRRGAASAAGTRVIDAVPYYQALSLQKLGQNDRARVIFGQLVQSGTQQASAQPDARLSADARYLAGLGHSGLNENEKARQMFNSVLQDVPDHLGARNALDRLQQ